jgi:hypothetical protein
VEGQIQECPICGKWRHHTAMRQNPPICHECLRRENLRTPSAPQARSGDFGEALADMVKIMENIERRKWREARG